MAITLFTGPPGSGKSHALVKELVIPAIMSGRRVLSNIDGLDVDAVRAYCLDRDRDPSQLGELVVFHGDQAIKPGFWPDEAQSAGTFVQGGDLVVFDEWALYFPRRGNWPPGCNVEAFLRWHRHLNGADGTATDVAIGSQLATDIHQNVRGLVAKSYKFRKLTALGAQGQYTWQLFEGHLQPKGGHYRTGTGTYDKAIFPLYASSAAAKEGRHVELRTNKKESIWSGGQSWAAVLLPIVLFIGGGWALWHVWHHAVPDPVKAGMVGGPGHPAAVAAVGGAGPGGAAPVLASSTWRIIGFVGTAESAHVILSDDKGTVRVVQPTGFSFDGGRPVSGTFQGQSVVASDDYPAGGQEPNMMQTAVTKMAQ